MVSASTVSASDAGTSRRRRVAIAVVAATLVALVLRFVALGDRVFHWDEARVGYWILRYQATGEWHYRAIVHGPFLFHVNELLFGVFGASDAIARYAVALVGGLLPLAAWLFRTRLDDVEVAALAVFLALNPVLVYYSRFMRNDVLVGAFALFAVGFAVHAIDTGRGGYLVAAGAALGLAFTAKENALVYAGIFVGAGALLLDGRLFTARARGESWASVAGDRVQWAGREVGAWWRAIAGGVLAFALVVVVFYAPRPELYRMFGDPSLAPAVLGDATLGAWSEFWGTWGLDSSVSRKQSYIEYLMAALKTLGAVSLVVTVAGAVGFLADRYLADDPRDLVQFAGYWALASVVLYPIITDIPGHWSVVHAVVPLTIPAAVGVRLVVDRGRSSFASGDRVGATLAVVVLLAAGAQAAVVTAETSYTMPQDEDNALVQHGQPGSQMGETLATVRSVARANEGTDVFFYGSHFNIRNESVAAYPHQGIPQHWFWRLPLNWYLERASAETDSAATRRELAGVDAPVVITRAKHYRTVEPTLDGYESWTYELTSSNTVIVVFVDRSAQGYTG
ncbi:flippase activity-associated protein Agl23 [Halobacterium zhouii]|uniref:flippase activity-associated protein Agl23 n=1 Tax=Halobacterium zhouii TaxID=2902624 RepID=UPI001E5BF55D|nr:flippase activity-associated protein Agl23 [Halobacterium zhouii]